MLYYIYVLEYLWKYLHPAHSVVNTIVLSEMIVVTRRILCNEYP